MKSHTDFILSPIANLLKNAVSASSVITSGIETFPLCDYIMQSVFLKMTGFQEQKIKCIAWEMASNDYEYRRILLANNDKLGEYSSYEDKNKIYKRLIGQIQNLNFEFNLSNEINKTIILQTTIAEIQEVFASSNLSIWAQKSYLDFITNGDIIKKQHFANSSKSLFETDLLDKYKTLYLHRNRCAHNSQSYQQDLPTLKTLSNENYKNENYFVWFALLILIDKIFIALYEKYQEGLSENI